MTIDGKDKQESTSSLGRLSRRSFLTQVGAARVATAAAAAVTPLAASAVAERPSPAETVAEVIPGLVAVTLHVNGKTHAIRIDPRATLLDTLGETIHLTGTKKGCDHGQCGACTAISMVTA